MKSNLISVLLAMLFSCEVWAVYGLGMKPRKFVPAVCDDCDSYPVQVKEAVTTTFEAPLPISTPSIPLATALIPHKPALSAPPVNTSLSTRALSTGASIGIGIGVTVFIVIIGAIACGVPYVRNRRRARALERAVEEVERGIEMHKDAGHERVIESKENMVLESKVEIVVEDSESESGAVDRWDGWDASWEEEDDEMERGRKGMSLPRREY